MPSGEAADAEPDKPKKRRGFLFFGQKKDQPGEPEPVEEEVVEEFEETDPAKRSFWQKLTSKTPEPGTRKKKKKKFRWPWSQEKEVPVEEPEAPASEPARVRPVGAIDPLPMPEIKPREPETGLAPSNPNPPPPGKKPDPIDEIDLYPGRN